MIAPALRPFLATLLLALLSMLVIKTDAFAEASQTRATGFTLANGMQVVVIPDRRAPVVTHMVWYRVGAADEERGVSGIAHFLAHLMFKSTEKFPAAEFSKGRDARALAGGDGHGPGQQRQIKTQTIRVFVLRYGPVGGGTFVCAVPRQSRRRTRRTGAARPASAGQKNDSGEPVAWRLSARGRIMIP